MVVFMFEAILFIFSNDVYFIIHKYLCTITFENMIIKTSSYL